MISLIKSIISLFFLFIFFRYILNAPNHMISLILAFTLSILIRSFLSINRLGWNSNGLQLFIVRVKDVWRIQKVCLAELALGVIIMSLLCMLLERDLGREISLSKAAYQIFTHLKWLDFSIIFIFSSMTLIVSIALLTSLMEVFYCKWFTRWILVPLNCIPIYIYVEIFRSLYGTRGDSDPIEYSMYGAAALLFGNLIWLFLHDYFVENIKKEMSSRHMETALAMGLKRRQYLGPRMKLMILDILRPLFLILMGGAVFVEPRFNNDYSWWPTFEGMSFKLFSHMKHLWYIDRTLIITIFFSVLIVSISLQAVVNHYKAEIDPLMRNEK